MLKINEIKAYKDNLVNNMDKIDLNEFFNYIIKNIHSNLDLSFKDYFMEICDKDGKFIINHSKLVEFKVINNAETSAKIKRCLDKFKDNNKQLLIEGRDYQVSNIGQQ